MASCSVGQRLEAREGWAALCGGCRWDWAEQRGGQKLS